MYCWTHELRPSQCECPVYLIYNLIYNLYFIPLIYNLYFIPLLTLVTQHFEQHRNLPDLFNRKENERSAHNRTSNLSFKWPSALWNKLLPVTCKRFLPKDFFLDLSNPKLICCWGLVCPSPDVKLRCQKYLSGWKCQSGLTPPVPFSQSEEASLSFF